MTEPAFAITEAIGDLVAAPNADFDESLLDRAGAAVTDTVGVMLAGAAEPAVTLALQLAQAQFATTAAPATAVLAPGGSLSASGAALVNGVAAHALDYDDVSSTVTGHPSAVLVPVLLALAEASGSSGREVIEAYLVGLHVSSGVGAGLDLHAAYARGWHMTSVLGALGAAAAAARLRGLSAAQARSAIGIAGSVAAGSRASFGTMVKPLHVGMTALEAVLAVELAAADFTANPSLVEAPLGFLALHAESVIDPFAIEQALARPIGAPVRELDVKYYPCCYHTHRMIDAALAVRPRVMEAGLDAVEEIRVTTAPGGAAALIHHWPMTATEAKFSAEYTVSTSLVDGSISSASFDEVVLERPAVRALMKRVQVDEQQIPPAGPRVWSDSYAVIDVLRLDGTHAVERVDAAKGAHGNPLTPAELAGKFHACAARYPGGTVDGARALGLVSALRYDTRAGSLLRRIISPELG
jgi:2-methylcitrate dehydratase PrpD